MEITDFETSGSTPEPEPPPAVIADPPPAAPVAEPAPEPEAQSLEPEAEEAEQQTKDDKGRFQPKKSTQARIDRLTFEREEARREAARLAAELASYRTPKAPEAPKQSAPAADEPALASFETYEDWIKAWTRWDNKRQVEEVLTARERDQQARRAADEQRTNLERFTAQVAKARQTDPNWDAMIADADAKIQAGLGGQAIPHVMQAAILQSEKATEILRDLATHPEDAIQLARSAASVDVSAAPLMRSMLESRLARSAAHSGPATPPVRTLAPAPIKPVGSAPVIADAIPGDDADLDTHIAFWNRKDRERRK